MADQTVVEINGKKYDANTGQLLSAQKPEANSQVIDGFQANKRSKRAAKDVHSQTNRSQTLNRDAVSKPESTQALIQKKRRSKDSAQKSRQDLAQSVDTERTERSKRQGRSKLISKYGLFDKVSPSQPDQQKPEPSQDQPPAPVQKLTNPLANEQPSPQQDDQQPPKNDGKLKAFRKRRPKFVPTMAVVASALILTGYIVYLNIPNVALKIAASRAGIDATLPGYRPAGFKFGGPIAYSPGQITVQFTSTVDERGFLITERESSWDSQSLLDNHVARKYDQYLTFHERGLTVYIFEGSNATWVDGGIWYTIEGDSLLNSEQLLKIAASL